MRQRTLSPSTAKEKDVSPNEPISRDEVVAEVSRNAWWAFYGPLPAAPYVRAIVEVVADSLHTECGLPPRLERRTYIYYAEALDSPDGDWLPIVDRFSQMTDEEFQRLVDVGEVVPLPASA
jgi:hypothetical protein